MLEIFSEKKDTKGSSFFFQPSLLDAFEIGGGGGGGWGENLYFQGSFEYTKK